VADRSGSAEVLLPADLLDARGPAEPETRQEVTDAFARYLTPRLVRARWLHADLGPVLDTILAALPRTGEAALAHVARFADVLSVVAHPELAVLPYETGFEVLGRSLRPVSASVSLRVVPRELAWVGVTALVTGHINMTQVGFGLSQDWQQALSGTLTIGTGGPDGSATGSGSVSAGTSRRQATAYGLESLAVNTGLQYAYLLQVDPVLTVLEGGRGGRQPLDRGTVLVTFPERDVLEWYGEAGFPVPLGQVADAVERLRNGSLTLDPAVAIPLVRRYLDDLAAAGPGAADHSPQQLIDWLTGYYPEVANRVELLAPVVGDGFRVVRVEEDDFLAIEGAGAFEIDGEPGLRALLDHLASVLQGPVPVDLAEHLGLAGLSDVERADLVDRNGEPVPDLAGIVLDVLDRLVPEVVDDRPELRRGVRGLLGGGERWWGRLRDMIEPGGFTVLDEDIGGNRVVVYLEAHFGADQAELLGRDPDTGLISQTYVWQTSAAGASAGWGAGGRAGTPALGPELAVATDRSHSGSRTTATTLTTLSRQAKFGGVERVRHPIGITITVRRTIGWRRPDALVGEVAQGGNRVRVVLVGLGGTVIRLVPAGLALRRVPPQHVAALRWRTVQTHPHQPVRYADVRQGRLPDRFVTEDTESGDLPEMILALLALPSMLGEGGVLRSRLLLERQLSPLALRSSLRFVQSEGGHRLVLVDVPGRPDEFIEGWVSATVSENQQVLRGNEDVEIGKTDRTEDTTPTADDRSRLDPVGRFVTLGPVPLGSGEQGGTNDTVGAGERHELTDNEKGSTGTNKVRLDFSIELRRWRAGPDGLELLDTVVKPKAAIGSAYVTAFDAALAYAAARLEDDADLDHGDWAADRGGAPPALSMAELYPERVRAELLSETLSETKAWLPRYYNVYPAMATKVRDRVPDLDRPGSVIRVTATENRTYPYRELIRARLLARELGVTVLADVTDADGVPREYRAEPDGNLFSRVDDGGFANALGHVDYLLQEHFGQELDLRHFFHDTRDEPGTFSAKIRAELSHRGRRAGHQVLDLGAPLPFTPEWTASHPATGSYSGGFGQGGGVSSGLDAWVPGSGSHGTASLTPRPAVVRAEVAAELAEPQRLAASAGITAEVGADRSVRWFTAAGAPFELLGVDVVPATAVGAPSTVDGVERWPTAGRTVRTGPAGSTVALRVSDQARVSTDRPSDATVDAAPGPETTKPGVLEMRRALAHDLAEAAAVIDDAPDVDLLTGQPPAAGWAGLDLGQLSAHDRGRLAEIGVLLDARADPALQPAADAELRALLDHLVGPAVLDGVRAVAAAVPPGPDQRDRAAQLDEVVAVLYAGPAPATAAELVAQAKLAAVLDALPEAPPRAGWELRAAVDRLIADLQLDPFAPGARERRARLGPRLAARLAVYQQARAAAGHWRRAAATTVAAATDALERAAVAAGAEVRALEAGLVEVRPPGQDPVQVELSVEDVPGGRPVEPARTGPDTAALRLNSRFPVAALQRAVTTSITGTVLAARGDVPTGLAALSASESATPTASPPSSTPVGPPQTSPPTGSPPAGTEPPAPGAPPAAPPASPEPTPDTMPAPAPGPKKKRKKKRAPAGSTRKRKRTSGRRRKRASGRPSDTGGMGGKRRKKAARADERRRPAAKRKGGEKKARRGRRRNGDDCDPPRKDQHRRRGGRNRRHHGS
jgi:hypothetical protein